ncbi:40S ribosomal protein S30 [Canna indica]|uniref:40S ribosomal protein S30 n=1 Tax=Canna indica TaxID=4628 RepID=A0AAQ3Q585_9LILI|nr:40S ribosomal protein S30 [Canna indica]
MGKVHGSLARAGKVRGQTPKVAKQDKKKKPRGRAHKRMQYNRRFVTAVVGFGKKRGPNSSENRVVDVEESSFNVNTVDETVSKAGDENDSRLSASREAIIVSSETCIVENGVRLEMKVNKSFKSQEEMYSCTFEGEESTAISHLLPLPSQLSEE